MYFFLDGGTQTRVTRLYVRTNIYSIARSSSRPGCLIRVQSLVDPTRVLGSVYRNAAGGFGLFVQNLLLETALLPATN